VTTTTRLVIEQDILKVLRHDDDSVSYVPVPTVTTALGSTTTLKATALGRGSPPARHYERRAVKIAELVGAGPAVGEIAAVDVGGFDGTDTLTVSPAFSGSVQSGTDFNLYPLGWFPETITDEINAVLRATDAPWLWGPTLVTDGDFESGDVSNWAAVGTPTTRSYTTTTGALLLGERRLSLAGDTDEGAHSALFAVHEDEQLIVSVFLAVAGGSAKVQLFDATNSTVVKSVTVEQAAHTEVRFVETVPAGCLNMRIRLLAAEDTSSWIVSPPVIVQVSGGRPYPAPAWFLHERQYIDSFALPQGFSSVANDSYVALSQQAQNARRHTLLRQDRGLNPLHFELDWLGCNAPILVVAYRTFAELSTDTASTQADREFVVARTLANLLLNREEGKGLRWAQRAAARAVALRYGQRVVRMTDDRVLVARG
jgi:hypothetical protein